MSDVPGGAIPRSESPGGEETAFVAARHSRDMAGWDSRAPVRDSGPAREPDDPSVPRSAAAEDAPPSAAVASDSSLYGEADFHRLGCPQRLENRKRHTCRA